MAEGAITIRLMKAGDFDAVVGIDQRVLGSARPDYYAMKFEKLLESAAALPVSLVAETAEGTIVGFVMGELYMGEYGIHQKEATLDTIGVDPTHQHHGVGELLITEFVDHVKTLGVQKVFTLVSWNDTALIRFFSANRFVPSTTINLERVI